MKPPWMPGPSPIFVPSRKIWYPDMPSGSVLESQASETAVCVTEVVRRFAGAVEPVVGGGGGGVVVVGQGAVAADSVAAADLFCAASAASTPNVYVRPHSSPPKSPAVAVALPTFVPSL